MKIKFTEAEVELIQEALTLLDEKLKKEEPQKPKQVPIETYTFVGSHEQCIAFEQQAKELGYMKYEIEQLPYDPLFTLNGYKLHFLELTETDVSVLSGITEYVKERYRH